MLNVSLVTVTKSKQYANSKITNSVLSTSTSAWALTGVDKYIHLFNSLRAWHHCRPRRTAWLINCSAWWDGEAARDWVVTVTTGVDGDVGCWLKLSIMPHTLSFAAVLYCMSKCFTALVDQSQGPLPQEKMCGRSWSIVMPSTGRIWRHVCLACPWSGVYFWLLAAYGDGAGNTILRRNLASSP